VFIKALRNIKAGEELFYDYGLIIDAKYTKKLLAEYPCWCGAKNCRGTLLAPKDDDKKGKGKKKSAKKSVKKSEKKTEKKTEKKAEAKADKKKAEKKADKKADKKSDKKPKNKKKD
ncbi:MAG: SET domain-containing protein-lysine N-methyltransferase, partial [Polaromonas sp.]